MLDRFYVDDQWSEFVQLSGNQAHHLSRVLRKNVGDEVELFDGAGRHATAKVVAISKREVELRLLGDPIRTPKPNQRITLAVAPPKRDRFQWLIEKATEIGVERIIPIQTQRTVVVPGQSKLDRLQQTVIEACKQCRRDYLLELLQVETLESLAIRLDVEKPKVVHGAISSGTDGERQFNGMKFSENIVAVIGPEGGFTEDETEFLDRLGSQPLTVSPFTLRTETAAIAIASILKFKLNSE